LPPIAATAAPKLLVGRSAIRVQVSPAMSYFQAVLVIVIGPGGPVTPPNT
jgi:hypothetical protein